MVPLPLPADGHFNLVDVDGAPVLRVTGSTKVLATGRPPAPSGQQRRLWLTLADVTGEDVVAHCCQPPQGADAEFLIHHPNGDLFARMASERDVDGPGGYLLACAAGGAIRFRGNVEGHSLRVTSEDGLCLAETSPRDMDFRGSCSPHCQLRAFAGTDVSLVLCGLLSLLRLQDTKA